MEWVETTGKTVEEAKEMALDILGVDYIDAEFEILEEPKSGFLGISKKLARIKARVKPTVPRAKDTRRPRRRKVREETEKPKAAATPAVSKAAEPPVDTVSKSAARGEPVSGRTGAKPSSRNGNRGPKRGSVEANEGKEPEMETESMSLAEQATVAQSFLAGILNEIGLEGTVAVDGIEDDTINISVTGAELGLLIGPRGAVLAAVQDMTRTVVQRNAGGRSGRIVVDIDGYREKRRGALEAFARKLAEEVRDSGVSKVFEPMNSSDRKIVHDVIGEIAGVKTRSEGYEPRRYVVVEPVTEEVSEEVQV
ncbi:MAG: Jag N-terminal domain-containing protein [Actinomycetota bacterium]|jgi:spoIIIJ-associated protein|nr:Jag N-terminal domain-containing protein [Actinomycetota bacterium]